MAVALPETSVLIDYSVDMDPFQKVVFKPCLNKIDIFRVTMAEDHGVFSVFVDVKDLKLRTRFRVKVEVVRVHRETGHWRLK